MSRLRTINIAENLWNKYVIDWEKEFGNIFWSKIDNFVGNNSYTIECCCGKGEFLVEKAGNFPSHKFIGIDYDYDVLARAVKHTDKNNLKNIIYLYNDVNNIFKNFNKNLSFSLDKIYINFPDPWPKKRHWKRRVIQTSLLINIYKLMHRNTQLHIVTDHDGYARWIKNHLKKLDNLFKPKYTDWYTTDINNLEPTTYMKKAIQKDHTINQFIVEKISS